MTRGPRYAAYTSRHLGELLDRAGFDPAEKARLQAVATVLPFRVNDYVVKELIDWSAVPDDPIYRLTFPQADMLPAADRAAVEDLLRRGASKPEVDEVVRRIRDGLRPHPAGQLTLNVASYGPEPVSGLQHKYAQTVLVFPQQGQTCHAYCAYCFRWPQFVGDPALKIATESTARVHAYIREHREISSVLFTGGDPLVMSTAVLRRYIEPLLAPDMAHVESIRIGTKALAYWPYRLLADPDADDLLRLFDEVRATGRHLAVMAHYSHPRELRTEAGRRALQRLTSSGVLVRSQAPLIRGVNDDPDVWAEMWRIQVRSGVVPYYMFVERDTGPSDYFAVPLVRAHEIFTVAYRQQSGLGRTVRGPVMSATPGKVSVDGVTELNGERLLVLRLLQARRAELVGRPFFARYDETATWLDDLVPLPGTRFPFDDDTHLSGGTGCAGSSDSLIPR